MPHSFKWFVLAIVVGSPAFAAEVYEVQLNGAQVPTGSTFTGTGTVTLNIAETQITVAITHNIPNANVTDGHIHQGAVGVNGGIVLPFPGQGENPINEVINVSPSQVATLRAGNYYVNIHTLAFPNGEIRGQIVPADTDQDLLTDVVETDTGVFVDENDTGTDPNDPDSDDDGVLDGTEVELNTDPNNGGSFPILPVGMAVALTTILAVLLGSGIYYHRRQTSRVR